MWLDLRGGLCTASFLVPERRSLFMPWPSQLRRRPCAAPDSKLISSCGSITGDRWVHVVSSGESWTTIGARVGVDPAVLAHRNGLAVGVPLNPGDVLGIDNRHIVPGNAEGDELLINLPQLMLFDYREGAVRASYPIAVGRPDWPTPVGPFSIVAMESDPNVGCSGVDPGRNAERRQACGRPRLRPTTPSANTGSGSVSAASASTARRRPRASTTSPRTAASGCTRTTSMISSIA